MLVLFDTVEVTVFVQQFVTIDRPAPLVAEMFERAVVPTLGELVASAWRTARPEPPYRASWVSVGARRVRPEGVVYAMSWPASPGRDCPEADFDLEFSSYDLSATHAQVIGQLRFPWLARWSPEERAAERRTMADLETFLTAVAARVIAAPAA